MMRRSHLLFHAARTLLGLSCAALAACGSNNPPVLEDGGSCAGGQLVCGGFCTDVQDSTSNCGACGHDCGAGHYCSAGTCQAIGVSGGDGGSCGAGEKLCAGACTDVQNNPQDCGDCGISCGANSYCSSGACVSLCSANQTSCGVGASAVCVQTDTDPKNCGGCGNECPDGGFCENATCTAACTAWLHTACAGQCVSLLDDPHNCGSCGTDCGDAGVCSGGHCGQSCGAGYTTCGTGADTTCAATQSDPNNCGSCGARCAAGEVCAYGECRSSCYGQASATCDGLCADLLTDRSNCGACGHACGASEVCSEGSCAATCASSDVATPYTLCGSGGNAYCASLEQDPANCGSCGHSCGAGQVCSQGACEQACFGTRGTSCGGACTDVATDKQNCGGCGLACAAGQVCAEGSCQSDCSTNAGEYTTCGSGASQFCANTKFDPENCGACGAACDGGVCSDGACAPACAGDTVACGSGKDAFCTDLNSDTQNCGGCGLACPVPDHGRAVSCTFGACGFACNPGFAVCGDGCCGFSSVSAGVDHTCGVTESGDVMCWGANGTGQLGDGTTTASTDPVKVLGLGDAGPAAQVSAGADHSCAVMASGAVYCWGNDGQGQLGNNDTTTSFTAVPVTGANTGVAQVVSGGEYWGGWTCEATDAGAARCWGYNYGGQLGTNDTMDRHVPTAVIGLSSGVTDIAASAWADRDPSFHDGNICVVVGGAPECWGNNYYGQLGNGAMLQSPQPSDNNVYTPTPVLGLTSGVLQVAAGVNFACARTAAGGVECWGWNANGELGDNTIVTRATVAGVKGLSSGVTNIGALGSHVCALTHTGAVVCWGYNGYGQLGNDSTVDSSVPVSVNGLTAGVSSISVGYLHTCAINAAGQVVCWGDNSKGQLGTGDTTPRMTPTPIQ